MMLGRASLLEARIELALKGEVPQADKMADAPAAASALRRDMEPFMAGFSLSGSNKFLSHAWCLGFLLTPTLPPLQ